MNKYLKYLKALLRHKWFVLLESCKLGIPLLGIVHDISKFLPDEFIPYAKFFYGEHEEWEEDYIKEEFDLAWLKHQKRNKHHWQSWILMNDSGYKIKNSKRVFKQVEPQEMPLEYLREMLADWRGAGRAYGNADTKQWYLTNREYIVIHPTTQMWIALYLGIENDL